MGDFIFVYDLYRSNEILPIVGKFAKKNQLEYVNYQPVSFLKRFRYRNLKYCYYTDGPDKFLWFCKNSKFVITSSFHGTIFALLFKRPFYSILWDKPEKQEQNGRIIYLLEQVGLLDRAFKKPKEILAKGFDTSIDWNAVHKKLEELKKTRQIGYCIH